jgi:uncharacterized protein YmfQ (DUF2313 family)
MIGLQRTYIYVGRPTGRERLITPLHEALIYLRSSLAKEAPVFEYDFDDYAAQLIALLPRGAAWDNVDSGLFGKLVYAIAAELERASDKMAVLLNETFPPNTTQLLGDWERVLGLPHDGTIAQSMPERRAAVVTKLATVAEPTPSFFVRLASDFGYAVEVLEYFPARVGRARIGDRISANGHEFTWSVRIPGSYTQSRRAIVGDAVIGDRIATWGQGSLEALIEQYKPAHTSLNFLYE